MLVNNKLQAAPTVKGDPSSPWRKLRVESNPYKRNEIFPGCDTIGKVVVEISRDLLISSFNKCS